MYLNLRFWLRISLINLFIVALLGTLMRYKIGFEFPYFEQKHLAHGHSHFAFIGWITHTLFVLMVSVIQRRLSPQRINTYRKLIILNLISAYGMLITFIIQGYGLFSISFSTLSVLTSYFFAAIFFNDMGQFPDAPFLKWFVAAFWFNIISSLGTFTLAFMMASHNFDQKVHLASLYFYLHFQYNGFFTFAGIGLFLAKLAELRPEFKADDKIFAMFFFSCIPAYFLSTLWMDLPVWLYVVIVAAAFTQVFAWIVLLRNVLRNRVSHEPVFRSGRYLLLVIGIAFSIKLLLQLGSTVPVVSQLAFGFRPIVIAYLHLVLLAIFSVFLISYIYIYKLIPVNRLTSASIFVFVASVYLNELVLGIQGIAAFSYTVVPSVNTTLFVVAALILTSVLLLNISQSRLFPANSKDKEPG
jgi:hypothetical protein